LAVVILLNILFPNNDIRTYFCTVDLNNGLSNVKNVLNE